MVKNAYNAELNCNLLYLKIKSHAIGAVNILNI